VDFKEEIEKEERVDNIITGGVTPTIQTIQPPSDILE